MEDLASQDELLRALGKLVRGLSALFWGLPLTLIICVRTAVSDRLRTPEILPPILATCLLFYGLALLGDFQKQERVWRQALDRAKTLAVVNIGLSPFVFWWNKIPGESFYTFGVAALMLSGLVFVFNLNHVLQRLAAMLPDETVRLETRFFGSMNLNILCALVGLTAFYLILRQIDALPDFLISVLKAMDLSRVWMSMFMILLPIAMTMTLIWKIKEVIFASVLAHRR